jgi:hypothetical protein
MSFSYRPVAALVPIGTVLSFVGSGPKTSPWKIHTFTPQVP